MQGARVLGTGAVVAALLGAAGCSGAAPPAQVSAASSAVTTTATASAPASSPPSAAPDTSSARLSSSASPSASSSVPPALTPAQASALESDLTTTGAENFVRAYIGVENRMRLTGDSTQFRTWSLPDCQWCDSVADDADGQYAKGWSYRGETVMLSEVSAPPPRSDGGVGVTFNLIESSYDSVHSDGSVRRFDGTVRPEHLIVLLIPVAKAWRVLSLEDIPSNSS